MGDRPRQAPTGDVKCLRCGAMNLPENRICGRCGANLPLVYDEDGHVVRLQEDSQRTTRDHRPPLPTAGRSADRARWMMRLLILLFAVLGALWILAHK